MLDADAMPRIKSALRRSRHSIVIAPAVLFEAAHTPDKVLRSALLSTMVDRSWKRLMPEAFSEANELKSEIRRLRKDWLRKPARLNRYKVILHDWTKAHGGLWDKIEAGAELLQHSDHEYLQHCRNQAYALRRDGLQMSPQWRTADLKQTMGAFTQAQPGWGGQAVEAWRLDGMNVLSMALTVEGHPTVDWIEGEIDIQKMRAQETSLTQFWCYEVQVTQMPRHWIRWAMEFLQRLQKTNDGTPVDIQIGTHLVEVDLMLSSDQRFVAVAEKCRQDAPFRVAKSMVVPAGAGSMDALENCLLSNR